MNPLYVGPPLVDSSGLSEFSTLHEGALDFAQRAFVPGANTVLLEKRAAAEFAVYTPISRDGIWFARWLFTNRFNPGTTGAARMYRCSLASCNPVTTQAVYANNQVTEVEGQTATVSQSVANATSRTGSWTAAATIQDATLIRYSTTIGDQVIYTITGVSRIALRTVRDSSNGGISNFVVKQGGVEIPSGNYIQASALLGYTNGVAGMHLVPIATGLDPLLTYTVEVTVDASNGVSKRIYDGGIRGYTDREFDATGHHGVGYSTNLGTPTVSTRGFVTPGTGVVYKVEDSTKIQWRGFPTSNSGIVTFKVFDANGDEIDAGDYTVTSADLYVTSALIPIDIEVARGLEKGTYYLHVISTTTKNASSTDYRMYDFGVRGVDETTAGTPGTDRFDTMGVTDLEFEYAYPRMFIGTGNLECAVFAFKPGETIDDGAFVGGLHGHESAMSSFAVTDGLGNAIDFAGGAVGAQWVAASGFVCSFETELRFPSDESGFADVGHEYSWTVEGYKTDLTRTWTADARVAHDYAFMLVVPRPAVSAEGIGGGFRDWDIGRVYRFETNDNAQTAIYGQPSQVICHNAGYAVRATQLNASSLRAELVGSVYDGDLAWAFVEDRTDNADKYYHRAQREPYQTSPTVPIGFSYQSIAKYEVAKWSNP